MSDKKIIVLAIILSSLLVAGGWYYSKHGASPASIGQPEKKSETPTAPLEPGIQFGNPGAPVSIEEYTNFMCPACARFASDAFEKIKTSYVASGKVKFVFYLLSPLELIKASLCSEEQGKFLEYHDYAFSHQDQITDEKVIKDFAVNIGVDEQKFNECYNSDQYNAKAENWHNQAKNRGVDATPTFFINDQKFVGAYPFEDFQKIIEEKLNQVK